MSRILQCASHGGIAWHGEVICARDAGGCGRVWKLEGNADVPPWELNKHCVCGKPLVGDGATARAICADCYADRKERLS